MPGFLGIRFKKISLPERACADRRVSGRRRANTWRFPRTGEEMRPIPQGRSEGLVDPLEKRGLSFESICRWQPEEALWI